MLNKSMPSTAGATIGIPPVRPLDTNMLTVGCVVSYRLAASCP
jgi:hypothetical protein